MSKERAVEMFVGGLVLDPNTQAPVVVLKDESGNVHLPIWIGIAEATSIASAIKQPPLVRPLTHDLMHDIFMELGVTVQRVVITELRDSTYYSELILSIGDKALIFDSRPSDAIALALRASAPIYVVEDVLEQARASCAAASSQAESNRTKSEEESAAAEAAEARPEEEQGEGQDFKNIDKDKWEELLAKLDPDDFKYEV